jgi:uncharacterized YccA/Bax inhibitor family protein
MSNPVLSDKVFRTAAANGGGSGWGAPEASARFGGSISRTDTMTMQGTIVATGVMFVMLLAAAVLGWRIVPTNLQGEVTGFPAITLGAMLGGFVLAMVASFRPPLTRYIGPVYAVLEGIFVGSFSRVMNSAYPGIVLQAVGATMAVFAVMLVMYSTRILVVTDRMRRIVTMATLGIMVFYGISLLLRLFGVTAPFINDASGIGILFSFFVAGLAAFNLALNFDVIERGVKAGAPKYMEWYAGFGLIVTVVWLYLELLRLLSKVQRR